METPTQITDVLGRTRDVSRSYGDGAWDCPFCNYAARLEECKGRAMGYREDCANSPHCANPGCFANPHYPVAMAREALAEQERREAEERQRKRNHEWAIKRNEEGRIAREAKIAEIRVECQKRGACMRCAMHDAPYRTKYVKHRSKCPREK